VGRMSEVELRAHPETRKGCGLGAIGILHRSASHHNAVARCLYTDEESTVGTYLTTLDASSATMQR
jgi:hypothetical protein